MNHRLICLTLLLCLVGLTGCGDDSGPSADLESAVADRSDQPAGRSEEPVGALALGAGADTVVADGSSSVLLRATVRNTSGEAIEGAAVAFTASFGSFEEAGGDSTANAATGTDGTAEVHLVSTARPALALVTAQVGGFAAEREVRFVPGPADAGNSTITVNPQTVVADGSSTTTVTVSLQDRNGLPVRDGTLVTLVTSRGQVVSDNPAATASGRAEFVLQASVTQGSADVFVEEVPGIEATVTFGAPSTGEAAGIRLSVAEPEIAVEGVGQVEETKFTVQVVDTSGDPIDEANYGDDTLDNLRVRFATRPNGGEFLTGVNGSGEIVRAEGNEFLDVRTHGGSATLNLHSGRLPGSVELRVELLVDAEGNPPADPIVASLPLAAIASGPPHSIVLTYPVQDAIEPDDGVYRLVGKAIVNDRWGNPVPDGTAVYLGVLDSVIASGGGSVGGSTLDATGDLVSGENFFVTNPQVVGSTVFEYPVDTEPPVLWNEIAFRNDDDPPLSGSVMRNDRPPREIERDDRVLLFSGVADRDKSRLVAAPPDADGNTLEVQTPYSQDYADLKYVTGVSLLGGHMLGTTERGNFATATFGVTLTREGLADVIFDYPANFRTLNVGCGVVPLIDTRHPPFGSAEVLVVAESAGDPGRAPGDPDRAVAVSQDFCFVPLAGFDLEVAPSSLAGSGFVRVYVEDGTDVPVAFEPVVASVELGDAPEGGSFSVVATHCWTDESATCLSEVTILGATEPGEYTATIHYEAGDGATEVSLKFVR